MESNDNHSALNMNALFRAFLFKNNQRYNGYSKISDDYPCI